jgi:hypothetical protein
MNNSNTRDLCLITDDWHRASRVFVRDYGDVCQAVTNLAAETGAPISVDEFRTFSRCLDNAIVGAVTEFASHSPASNEGSFQPLISHLAPLAHELRNRLNTMKLAVTAIKTRTIGIGGATAAVLDENLIAMRNLIDRCRQLYSTRTLLQRWLAPIIYPKVSSKASPHSREGSDCRVVARAGAARLELPQ